MQFRGPKQELSEAFCALLGGSETYGKFVEAPFPALLQSELDLQMVNLGCMNAGLDVFVQDHALLELCGRARVTVLQVLGAQNISNAFYTVHPRRNDRVLRVSARLRELFPGVEFVDFYFTRHMLNRLWEHSPARFAAVAEELRHSWLERMRHLAGALKGHSVLLWIGPHPPEERVEIDPLAADPLFVDAAMIAALRPHFSQYVQVVAPPEPADLHLGSMIYDPLEEHAAREMPNQGTHCRIARALGPVVGRLMV